MVDTNNRHIVASFKGLKVSMETHRSDSGRSSLPIYLKIIIWRKCKARPELYPTSVVLVITISAQISVLHKQPAEHHLQPLVVTNVGTNLGCSLLTLWGSNDQMSCVSPVLAPVSCWTPGVTICWGRWGLRGLGGPGGWEGRGQVERKICKYTGHVWNSIYTGWRTGWQI